MRHISIGELRKLDLNLLLVFVTMMEEGSVTRTAERLYLTQPAVSAALSRLRDTLGEDLFVRVGRGLAPTARAQQIAAGVGAALASIQASLFDEGSFDPASTDRVFRLGVPDDMEMLLVPRLVATLAKQAPRARLLVRPVDFRSAAGALDRGDVELVVSVLDDLPDHVQREGFPVGGFSCLFDPRRVDLGDKPTLAAYLACRHVIVSYNGDMRGVVEDVLGRRGVSRDVALSLPRFASIAEVLSRSSLVATVPTSVARQFAKRYGLSVAPLPFSLGSASLEMAWHRALDRDPGHAFLRDRVRACTRRALGIEEPPARRRARSRS